jgi:hypothetical protein
MTVHLQSTTGKPYWELTVVLGLFAALLIVFDANREE